MTNRPSSAASLLSMCLSHRLCFSEKPHVVSSPLRNPRFKSRSMAIRTRNDDSFFLSALYKTRLESLANKRKLNG
ncbi:hypothetical protein AALP_AA5G257200 [Arabis alpina]|uniref:Uncharacterized protein n=1 Tax=Arabis alpina TaxID=50452 RepID=A0A087GZC8_ARAAL|nr:hypothetical protein AALP_AA5G257200 [Arabis alpina]